MKSSKFGFATFASPMRLIRRLALLFVFTALLIAVGIYLPRGIQKSWGVLASSLGLKANQAVISAPIDSLLADATDTTGTVWDRKLLRPLRKAHHLEAAALRYRGKKVRALLPKGLPLHEYAMTIERICERNGITRVSAIERRGPPLAAEYVLALGGDTLHLYATLGKAARPGSARLALVFNRLDSVSLLDADRLKNLPIAVNLIVNPYNQNPALMALGRPDDNLEVLLEQPMEPVAYPFINPGKQALYIHFNDLQVRQTVEAGLNLLPTAKGLATRFGDRAIENRPLLRRLFAVTGPRHLQVLDLTGSPRSLCRDVAAETGAPCRSATVFSDSNAIEMELARKTVLAGKTGEAIWVISFAHSSLPKLLAAIALHEPEFEAIGLQFVPLSSLARRNEATATEP